MIRMLTFTNLYPSARNPRHGIFVEQRLRRLVETGAVKAQVVVPVAHGPFQRFQAPPPIERFGIPIRYVPFVAVRGLTTVLNPVLMALAARREIGADDFDVLDAHFLYPDGVAACLLAGWFDKPFVMTARGSDVNVAAREWVAGACIRWAAHRAAGLVAVSGALRDAMGRAGIPVERIEVCRNGVDLDLFRPSDVAQARRELALEGPVLLSVGNLVAEKGHALTLAALAQLEGVKLLIIGAGPDRARLELLARELDVAPRVTWLEPVSQERLARYYAAADLTVLASTREGMPNVLLESLACGTPVVATAVGGASEIVAAPAAGRLLAERSAADLAAACRELLEEPLDRRATRAYAERFGWAEPIARLQALLASVVGRLTEGASRPSSRPH